MLARPPALAGAVLLSLACGVGAEEPDGKGKPSLSEEKAVSAALERLITRGANPGLARYSSALRRQIARFYAERGYAPLWDRQKSAALRAAVATADSHGLAPGEYGLQALARPKAPAGQLGTAAQRAREELLLSAAAILYVGDLTAGRFEPRRLNREIHLSPVRPLAADVLGRLTMTPSSRIGAVIDTYAPKRPEYRRLRAALMKYRLILARGGWPRTGSRRGLARGGSGAAVAALRRRLAATGDLQTGPGGSDDLQIFDDRLAAALRRYQRRNGLFVTGTVTALDLIALNRSVQERIQQIRLNMERRRWLQSDYGDTFVLVNQADFMVKLVRRGRTVYTSKIIIGTRRLRTPVFRAEMNEIGINPVWNVPASITRNELLPALRRNPRAYLRRHRMTLHDPRTGRVLNPSQIDWSAVNRGNIPFRLRQRPGARNALGRIKFMFPNPYNVYLHDTPAKRLFKRRVRCFSHGCMRLARPIAFAHELLRGEGWTRQRIVAAIAGGRRFSIYLKPPVPVLVVYLTAWADRDGTVQFRDDVYGRDARIAGAFARLDARYASPGRKGRTNPPRK